jgi:hypothetical protein
LPVPGLNSDHQRAVSMIRPGGSMIPGSWPSLRDPLSTINIRAKKPLVSIRSESAW